MAFFEILTSAFGIKLAVNTFGKTIVQQAINLASIYGHRSELIKFSARKFFLVSRSSVSLNISISNSIIKLLESRIDEEWQAILIDQRAEWEKSALTQNQIKRRKIIFIFSLYWGELVFWLQLPRFLFWTRVK